MEKVRHVVPGSQAIYVYKGSNYMDKPKMSIVKRYEYDKESNTTYIKVRKSRIPNLIVALLIAIAIVIYVTQTSANSIYNVTYTRYIVVRDGYAELDISLDDNTQGIMDIQLEYEGEPVIEPLELYSGGSVGSVPCIIELAPGDYDCVLTLSVANTIFPTKIKPEVVLHVLEDTSNESNEQ